MSFGFLDAYNVLCFSIKTELNAWSTAAKLRAALIDNPKSPSILWKEVTHELRFSLFSLRLNDPIRCMIDDLTLFVFLQFHPHTTCTDSKISSCQVLWPFYYYMLQVQNLHEGLCLLTDLSHQTPHHHGSHSAFGSTLLQWFRRFPFWECMTKKYPSISAYFIKIWNYYNHGFSILQQNAK